MLILIILLIYGVVYVSAFSFWNQPRHCVLNAPMVRLIEIWLVIGK